MNTPTSTLPATTRGNGFMAGAVARTNANGKVLGHTLSFIGSAPAGDVKKALIATGIKGSKELRKRVGQVLRGESDMAWALFDAQVSVARSMRFTPVRLQSNKDSSVLTARLEKAALTDEETVKAAAASLGKAELLKLIAEMEEREKQAAAKAGAINV